MSEIDKELLNDILAHAFDDMIFIMKVESDKKFTYKFINEVAKKKLGLTEEYIGQTIGELLTPEQTKFLNEQHQKSR